MSTVDRGFDEDVPASRHGRYADGTHKFQVTVRASVPGELELWKRAEDAAKDAGTTMAGYVRDAVRHYLACDM